MPSKVTSPLTAAPRGSRRAIALAVIDLPEPDSPTSPIASPAPISSVVPVMTSRSSPPSRSRTVRSCTVSSALIGGLPARPSRVARR